MMEMIRKGNIFSEKLFITVSIFSPNSPDITYQANHGPELNRSSLGSRYIITNPIAQSLSVR